MPMDKAYQPILNSISRLAASEAGLSVFPATSISRTLGKGLTPVVTMGDDLGNTLMVICVESIESYIIAYSFTSGKNRKDKQVTANSPKQLMEDARRAIKMISDAKAVAQAA